MKYTNDWYRYPGNINEPVPVLELTRRNLETLLAKLDDPLSQCMLIDPDNKVAVRAVENDAHYGGRAPGVVYMPSTGEVR